MKKHFSLAVLVKGFSGLVAQILLLRELLIVFSGNELSIGIILANWLVLGAFGSYVIGRRAERPKYTLEAFTVLTILFSLSLPLHHSLLEMTDSPTHKPDQISNSSCKSLSMGCVPTCSTAMGQVSANRDFAI